MWLSMVLLFPRGNFIASSNATAIPDPASIVGRPFARFADTAAFEQACYSRRL